MNARPQDLKVPLRRRDRIRQSIVAWLLRGVRVEEMAFGENTIRLNPGGAGDVIRWSATQAPLALGDIGMNTTSGRIGYYDGSARNVLGTHEAWLLDGSNTPTANQPMGTNKITGLGDPTAAQDAATKNYVDTRIAPQIDVGGATTGYIGTASITEINALSPASGDAVVAEDAGTPSAGTSDTLAAGDLAEFDGTSWKIIVTNSGGFPPANTRCVVATGSTFVTGGGLTASTDEGKIGQWSGSSLTPTTTSPVDGVIVSNRGEGSVFENKTFTYDGSVPTGVWVQSGGVGADHGGLTGLTDDDHTQYALLAGRAGGQTIQGDTAASGNLLLESTANATKGDVRIVSGTDLRMAGDDELTPLTDGQGKLGTAANTWGSAHIVDLTTGDLNMRREDDDGSVIHWTLREYPDGIRARNNVTGAEFDVSLKARSGLRGLVRRAIGF